jgi:hypothetical protein
MYTLTVNSDLDPQDLFYNIVILLEHEEQCFGSGFIWINGSGSESGPRQAKIISKKGKNENNFMFEEFSVGLESFPELECPL